MKQREGWRGYLLTLIVAAVAAAFVFGLGYQQQQCENRGGRLVKGVTWYECVEAR